MVGTIWRKAEYRKGKEGFTGRKNIENWKGKMFCEVVYCI
jgi:hypothetical protein